MFYKTSFLCFVSLTLLLTANASSYRPCTEAKECKQQMAHEFQFEYVRLQNYLTKEKLNIARDGPDRLSKGGLADIPNRNQLVEIVQEINTELQALEKPELNDYKKSKAASANADLLLKRAFDLNNDTENQNYNAVLLRKKAAFLGDLADVWRGAPILIKIRTDDETKEIEDIKNKLEGADKITTLDEINTRTAEILQQIQTFLNIEA